MSGGNHYFSRPGDRSGGDHRVGASGGRAARRQSADRERAQVHQPSEAAAFRDELVETHASEEELELTRHLVQALTREDLELAEYRDEYTEKMREIIEAKVAGQEVVSPPAAEEPQVVNLMEALKASVRQIEKPERKMAGSARSRAKTAPRKRKSG